MEYITLYKKYIALIEAKKTVPNLFNNYNEDFDKFIRSLPQKAIDYFSLFISIVLHRRDGNLSEKIKSIDFSKIGFQFILIIKNYEEEWCAPVMEALAGTMYHFTKE